MITIRGSILASYPPSQISFRVMFLPQHSSATNSILPITLPAIVKILALHPSAAVTSDAVQKVCQLGFGLLCFHRTENGSPQDLRTKLRGFGMQRRERQSGLPSKRYGGVLSILFTPDGKKLASGSSDNTVRLWDAEKGETAPEGHSGPVLYFKAAQCCPKILTRTSFHLAKTQQS